jgi:ADP-heptose:LPS heptosyltransferase
MLNNISNHIFKYAFLKPILNILFLWFKKIIFQLPIFFRNQNTVLLVKTDNIGDYILFRNFLKILRGSKEYAHKKIILIGNDSWRDLAESFDKDVVDGFFWINKKRYFDHIPYKLSILFKLRALKAHQIINTMHSRDTSIDDLAIFSGASNSITCEGDDVNSRFNKHQFLKYNKTIPSLPNTMFEFFRNKFFFEQLLESKIDITKTSFDIKKRPISKNQVVIFPSAAEPFRRWGHLNFSEVITLLSQYNSSFYFLILGNTEDSPIGNSILNSLNEKILIKNLCGKTTLVELVDILSQSQLLISNETSAVHMAAALDISAVCISNGNHFGRFNPYPLSMTEKIITLFPNDSFYDEAETTSLAIKYQHKSNLDINQIKPQTVFEAARVLLSR